LQHFQQPQAGGRLRLLFFKHDGSATRPISSACRRLIFLVLLPWHWNVPLRISVMKLGLILRAVILAALLSTPARAQLLKAIDPKQQADVNGKMVNFNDLKFNTISQPTKDLPSAPLANGNLKFHNVDKKNAQFNTLDMSTISNPTLTEPTVAKVNFTTRRADVDVQNDEKRKQADETTKKAPIKQRQIRPLTPAGEEELKNQLNGPPLDVH
jgi:hypothetical protein